jgi:hypothetical protein
MGLDMYAYKTRKQVTEYGFEEPDDAVRLRYWRKHPNLHGWMEKLYRKRGGEGQFNCVTLRLDLADINRLEKAVKKNRLPPTEGFFFGTTRPEEKYVDLQFITDARMAIKDGYTVYYDSWW